VLQHTYGDRVTPLIKGWKDLFTKVSDQQSLVQSLKESPYYGPFEAQCTQIEARLAALDEGLHGTLCSVVCCHSCC
jgi:dynein heavy chain 2